MSRDEIREGEKKSRNETSDGRIVGMAQERERRRVGMKWVRGQE